MTIGRSSNTQFCVRSPSGLRVHQLRVAVADEDPTVPAPQPIDLEAERGRGLMLVAALASRWGTALTGRGKSVWFELDRA